MNKFAGRDHRELYSFALYAPLPAVEKLVFIIVASYSCTPQSDLIANKMMWSSITTLEIQTGLPSFVVSQVVGSLVKSGLVEHCENDFGVTIYGVSPCVPALYEHDFLSRIYPCKSGKELEKIHAAMDSASEEIKQQLLLDPVSMMDMSVTQPTIYEMAARWRKNEVKRALTRSLNTKHSTDQDSRKEV